jgi:hypothetical protein
MRAKVLHRITGQEDRLLPLFYVFMKQLGKSFRGIIEDELQDSLNSRTTLLAECWHYFFSILSILMKF